MSRPGPRVIKLHAFGPPGSLLVTFDTGETHAVDLASHLGERAFNETFGSYQRFVDMAVDQVGGLRWEHGYALSGSELHNIGKMQTQVLAGAHTSAKAKKRK